MTTAVDRVAELRALDVEIHRVVMGQRVLLQHEMRAAWEKAPNDHGKVDGEWFYVHEHRIVGGDPTFAQDIPRYSECGASLVEREMEKRGQIVDYVIALWEVMTGAALLPGCSFTPAAAASLIRSTDEQRCRAALKVCQPAEVAHAS